MAFIRKTEELPNKKNSVKASSVLIFSLKDYHKSRFINQQVSSFENDDPNLTTITYNNNNNNNNYVTNNNSMIKQDINKTTIEDISKNGETLPTTTRFFNDAELKKLIKETKSDKCQNDIEKKTGIKKILNAYIKQKEIDKYRLNY